MAKPQLMGLPASPNDSWPTPSGAYADLRGRSVELSVAGRDLTARRPRRYDHGFPTLNQAQAVARQINGVGVQEEVADKGYHSSAVLKRLRGRGIRSYIPEPDRKHRHWHGAGKAAEKNLVYANRRRTRRAKSKQLQKLRSELTERSFAHMYETGGMRRVYLRGRHNILKRLLIQGAAFNLSLIMRKMLGAGKPRQFQGLSIQLFAPFLRLTQLLQWVYASWSAISHQLIPLFAQPSLASTS